MTNIDQIFNAVIGSIVGNRTSVIIGQGINFLLKKYDDTSCIKCKNVLQEPNVNKISHRCTCNSDPTYINFLRIITKQYYTSGFENQRKVFIQLFQISCTILGLLIGLSLGILHPINIIHSILFATMYGFGFGIVLTFGEHKRFLQIIFYTLLGAIIGCCEITSMSIIYYIIEKINKM